MTDQAKELIRTNEDIFWKAKEKFLDILVDESINPEEAFLTMSNNDRPLSDMAELRESFVQLQKECYYKFWLYYIIQDIKEEELIQLVDNKVTKEAFEDFYSSLHETN